MKRYDEYRYIESKMTGSRTYDLYPDEWKLYLNNPTYKVVVRCRKCGNHHKVEDICQVCDIKTKIKEM